MKVDFLDLLVLHLATQKLAEGEFLDVDASPRSMLLDFARDILEARDAPDDRCAQIVERYAHLLAASPFRDRLVDPRLSLSALQAYFPPSSEA